MCKKVITNKKKKLSAREVNAISLSKHRTRKDAIIELNKAVKRGDIKRPSKCEACGKRCRPKGYHEEPRRHFEVIWLCTACYSIKNPVVNLTESFYNIAMESTPIHLRHVVSHCAHCKKEIDGPKYSSDKGWLCEDCNTKI